MLDRERNDFNMSIMMKQMLNLITNDEGTKRLEWFMKQHRVILDPWYYTRLDELLKQYSEEINVDPNSIEVPDNPDGTPGKKFVEGESIFSINKQTCNNNARVFIFLYIVADIEATWKKFGAKLTGKTGPSKRLIGGLRNLVKKDLEERFTKTFIEIEKGISNFIAIKNGHFEGVYEPDPSIMDLEQRDATFKPETKPQDTSDSEEKPSENEEVKTESDSEEISETIDTGTVSGEGA